MAKAAFSKKKTVFTSKLDLIVRKKLVKWYVWCITLYGVETWTLGKSIINVWKLLKCHDGEE